MKPGEKVLEFLLGQPEHLMQLLFYTAIVLALFCRSWQPFALLALSPVLTLVILAFPWRGQWRKRFLEQLPSTLGVMLFLPAAMLALALQSVWPFALMGLPLAALALRKRLDR